MSFKMKYTATKIFFSTTIVFFLLLFIHGNTYSQCTKQANIQVKPNVDGPNCPLHRGESTGSIKLNYFISNAAYPYIWQWHEGSAAGKILLSGTASAKGATVKNDAQYAKEQEKQGLIENLPAGIYVLTVCNNLSQQLQSVTYTISENTK